ncbi:MAG: TolC family protein [Cellulosilyticaceae bacterium]
MNKNKLVACMLGTILLLGNTMPVLASESQLKVLTLEKAIKQANEVSRELTSQQRSQEYLLEKEDNELNSGRYGGYIKYNTDREYAKKKEMLEKEQITLQISKLFDEIIVAEKELSTTQKNILLKEKEIAKQELMYKNGMASELNLESIRLSYEQLLDSKKKIEDSIESKYSQLCKSIGTRTQRYALEKDENIFSPYLYEGSADSIAEKRAKEHLDVWNAEEAIKVAEWSFNGGSFDEYLDYNNRKEITKDTSRNIEDMTQTYIRDLYVQVRQLEQQYSILSKDIELKAKEIQVNNAYLEKGLISQVDYDKKVVAYEESKISLEKLVNNHTYLKKQLNNPSLISIGR